MSQKTVKKTVKPRSPKPAVKQDDTAYLVREDLDEQQERLRKEEAAGANALKTPAQPAAAEQAPTAAASSKPLAPLGALWPSSVPPRGESEPSQGPAPQKAPVTVTSPKPAPATAAPLPQPPAQSEPTQSPWKAAAVAEAPLLSAVPRVKVTFVLPICDAKRVSLSGEFNGWSPDATPMRRHSDGHWETTVDLAPGRYEYKFVRDGEWIPDLLAHENVWNRHGTLNSVIEVLA
jgi:hypothetical protein